MPDDLPGAEFLKRKENYMIAHHRI
uniref:Uncharacterized protein n=1 Tax=Arundo donax TaxID=35708 RepID=A0A0A9FUB1_ARUDO